MIPPYQCDRPQLQVITDENEDEKEVERLNLRDVAEKLLGHPCICRWPHFKEGLVTSVMDWFNSYSLGTDNEDLSR